MKLGGNFVAIVTPMHDNGEIDIPSFCNLLKFYVDSKVDGVVVSGTTGESATLSDSEFEKLVEVTVERVKGKCLTVAGVGGNDTQRVIKLAKLAQRLGVDALLAVVPYYNNPTQEGLYEHFYTLAESVDLPIILYNVPKRTSISLSVDTIVKLSKLQNILGIKEASGDLKFQAMILNNCPKDFALLSGDDFTMLATLSIGGSGVISVLSNIAPTLVSELIDSFNVGDIKHAKSIYYKLLPVIEALFLETNPVCVKEALFLMGKIESPRVRLPLVRMQEKNIEKLKSVLNKANFL